MRIAPIILIVLGFWGLVDPQSLLELEETQGRMVFVAVIALGGFSLWRTMKGKS